MAVIFTDAQGRPLGMNTAARHFVARRDGLLVDREQLRGASPAATRALVAALLAATRLAQGDLADGDAVAVVFENRRLTYRQLNEKSNQLAHFLRQQHQTISPPRLDKSAH